MSDTPRVTVLVPIYNVEKYLRQCLDSLAAQDYQNMQILCINDGSKDGSRAIIQEYLDRDERFEVLDKENSGYGDSLNRGLEKADGDYISILESDDFLDEGAISYMVGECEKDDLDFLKCNFWLYWSEPRPERAGRQNQYFEFATPDFIGAGVHVPAWFPESFWRQASIWSALYRKSFLDENGIRFLPTPGASYQDTSFTFKVFACARRARYSGRAFVHYRQDNGGSSINSKGKIYCVCDEHAEIKRFLEEDRPDLKPALTPIRLYQKYCNYFWNFDRLEGDAQKQFLMRFSQEYRDEIADGSFPQGLVDGSYFEDPKIGRYQFFSPQEAADLNEIVGNPKFFYARWQARFSKSKLETARTFLDVGGTDTLKELFEQKMGKRIDNV